MKIRSFLAFELPLEIKNIVARVSGELRQSTLNPRWVKVDNIHLTVVFMGSIETEDTPAITRVVREVCQTYGPFDISLKGIGCFPNRRSPRVLWLGLDGDLEPMSEFRDALQGHLKGFGIKEEKRKFKPHLTLARFRKPKKMDAKEDQLLSNYEDISSAVCSLKELILFKSDLKPTGAVYTKVESWPLTGDK
ncbi:MAG: RNA 2',3'-cyclic phosphodiesterase [Deltaproteobacteria bacterium]|nr:MAG: RNA 2',3'-cyclic phosphodiesterase [Deltaproteobacteria bacterium]